tara:strand:+ start:1000 stop:1110 length:111 start_codon:yes stop_codon:yes gene_type:complete
MQVLRVFKELMGLKVRKAYKEHKELLGHKVLRDHKV